MRAKPRFLITAAGAASLLFTGLIAQPGTSYAEGAQDDVAAGKKIAFDRKKGGNCLACHQIEGGESPGNIGPPLVSMKQRFPNPADLKAQLTDPEKRNPVTMMPPFGKNKILSDKEIDQVVAYLLTL